MTTAARHRHLILVGGGARSGKSKFALARAAKLGKHRVFIATAERSDDEMRERIAKHRVDRRHAGFDTREEPRSLPEAVAAAKDYDVVVVDCLTVWIANLLVGGMPLAAVEKRIGALLWVLERHKSHVIIVSNEVGMGLVPDTPLGRTFRDVIGYAHQQLAHHAQEIYFAAMGVMLRLRPEPVQLAVP
jgi:adenosylcobinamide kinase/adenosylcobinamide-phosphate guanylyltransferase